MKQKLFLLFILSFSLLMGCNKDKITLKITAPADGAVFSMNDNIDVNITATTKKGHITQVVLTVDTIKRFDTTKEPYDFLIEKGSFKDTGLYFLSVQAYSSEGIQEGEAVYIKIKE